MRIKNKYYRDYSAPSEQTWIAEHMYSLSLGIVPITLYFLSEKYVWNGNSNYAAITAIFAANAVLIAYIITSLQEDRESMESAEQKKKQFEESRKDQ